MRKLSGIIALLFVVGILFFSCEEYNINRGETIRAGELKNMDYRLYDTVIKNFFNDKDSFDLDADADGIADFRFYLEHEGSPSFSMYNLYLFCLHENVFIGGESRDSLMYIKNGDTLYYLIDLNCINRIQSNDLISIEDKWLSDTFNLIYYHSGVSSPTVTYSFRMEQIPDKETVFIGFKMTKSKKEKLGWMTVSNDNNAITIHESAIQK